jgi:hypothetical protein
MDHSTVHNRREQKPWRIPNQCDDRNTFLTAVMIAPKQSDGCVRCVTDILPP